MDALAGRGAFGLNFERHIPETVELPNRTVRRGDKVRFLPLRAENPDSVDGEDPTKEQTVKRKFFGVAGGVLL